MAPSTHPPKKLGELIDKIERMRDELLTIQTSLESMEAPKSPIKKK